MITVTFVRHGESTDNLRTVWAGWADAPLSNHGMNQARAAGEFFATTKFTAIYASPLKRAFSTAQAILDAQPTPKPSFTVSPDVREQHFGIAEGNPWSLQGETGLSREELYARGIYPVLYDRAEKFPDGESLNDLQERAERAMNEIVMPFVWETAKTGYRNDGAHIAVVSHGLCISELIAALARKDKDAKFAGKGGKTWTGLLNTAWTRLTIDVVGLQEGQTIDVNPTGLPSLKVKVTQVNEHSHLYKIKRQHGGIGSAPHDPAQKDIRAFFGGAAAIPSKPSNKAGEQAPDVPEEGRTSSNVYDEVVPDGDARP